MLDAAKDDFEYWMDDATRGLHPDAVRVIAAEMLATYESAREEALAAGMNDAEALEAAIQSLGDAKEARKDFRKSYPTWREAWLASSGLHNYVGAAAQVFTVGFFGWLFAETVLGLHSGDEQWSAVTSLKMLMPTGMIAMFAMSAIARLTMRRPSTAARLLSRAPLALFILPTLVWGVYGTVTQGSVIAYVFAIAYCVGFFWRVPLHWENIYRKTRRLAEASAM